MSDFLKVYFVKNQFYLVISIWGVTLGIPFSFSIDLAISMTVQFFLSDTSFCCGVYAIMSCLSMPSSSQNLSNSRDLYSFPRSLLSTFICFPLCFSTRALNFLNIPKTYDFAFKK